MKTIVALLVTMTSVFAFAYDKGFEIQIKELSINGSLMPNNRRLIVKPNQSQVISQSTDERGIFTIVEVTASNHKASDESILAKLTITEDNHGARKILATPQLIVNPGQEAKISEYGGDHHPSFSVSLVAKRVQ